MDTLVDDTLSVPDPLPCQTLTSVKHRKRFSMLNEIHKISETAIQEGQCPYCGDIRRQVKAGYSPRGIQRYLCQLCERRYTPSSKSNSYPEQTRKRAIQLHQEGMSFRQISQQLGVNH